MQIRGNEFLKKVQERQEREDLEKRLRELQTSNTNYIGEEQPNIQANNFQQNEPLNSYENSFQNNLNQVNDPNENELENIMLSKPSSFSNEDTKKKYILLGVVLLVLFLLTIIIIRLLTSDSSQEDNFTSRQTNDRTLNKESSKIEEDFQKLINERTRQESQGESFSRQSAEERLNNMQSVQEDSTTNNQVNENIGGTISDQAIDETMKKLDEKRIAALEEQIVPAKVEKKPEPVRVEKKPEPTKSVKDLVSNTKSSTSSTNAPNGYFVQVGAFSKKPSDAFINSIRNAGLNYTIYQQNVNGTLFNKVLIGPYPSKTNASNSVNSIKNSLNLQNAHVVKF